MSPRPNLALVDTTTGDLYPGCPRCEDVAAGDLENAERQIRKLERRIAQIHRNLDAERNSDPNRIQIIELIERWKAATGHTKSLASADRFDLVKARLKEGFTVEQLAYAVDGIAAYPYVQNGTRTATGSPAQRHDRLGIALGGGEAVERFANLGYEARKALTEGKG